MCFVSNCVSIGWRKTGPDAHTVRKVCTKTIRPKTVLPNHGRSLHVKGCIPGVASLLRPFLITSTYSLLKFSSEPRYPGRTKLMTAKVWQGAAVEQHSLKCDRKMDILKWKNANQQEGAEAIDRLHTYLQLGIKGFRVIFLLNPVTD